MQESNESQGNPEPTEREQEEAATERHTEQEAMEGQGHEDPARAARGLDER